MPGLFSTLKYSTVPRLCRQAGIPFTYLKSSARLNLSHTVLDTQYRSTGICMGGRNHPFAPVHFSQNSMNEYASLVTRVLASTPQASANYMENFRRFLLNNFHQIFKGFKRGFEVPSISEYLVRSNARASVKKAVERAHFELAVCGIDVNSRLSQEQLSYWTRRKAFIKVENLLYLGPCGVKNKAPRMIQGASPHFIALVGPWMMACQDALKACWSYTGKHKNSKSVIFSSGMNGEDIGAWAQAHGHYPCKGENDIGKFDASCREDLLSTEVMMFQKMGAPRAVLQLLWWNVNTRGITRFGIRYAVEGGRKSGDPYTSMGNSILNAVIHLYLYARYFKISCAEALSEVRMIVQGDDNLIFHPRKHVPWARLWEKMGFQAEPSYKDSIYDLSFCSARLMPVHDGVILSPNPVRVWMKFGVFAEWDFNNNINDVVSGSAIGNMINLYHIPGMADYFKQFISGTQRPRVEPWEIWLKKRHNPTPETLYFLDKYNMRWTSDWSTEAHTEMKCELNTDAPTRWFKPLKYSSAFQDEYEAPGGCADPDSRGNVGHSNLFTHPFSMEEVLGAVELNPHEVWAGWLPVKLSNFFKSIRNRWANDRTP
jgi:hypothetical protein